MSNAGSYNLTVVDANGCVNSTNASVVVNPLPNATATVVGNSTVYFMQAPGAPQVCSAKTPLTYDNISIYRIDANGTFDLSRWRGTNGVSYAVSADAGVLSSTQAGGSIY